MVKKISEVCLNWLSIGLFIPILLYSCGIDNHNLSVPIITSTQRTKYATQLEKPEWLYNWLGKPPIK